MMIELAELITAERVFIDLRSIDKAQVLHSVAEAAARATAVPADRIFEALLQREKLGTTALGNGVAIPHARLAELDRPVGFFAKLDKAIDFDALDDQPVDLVFTLLAPEDDGSDHLKALARVARVLRDEALCEQLRESERPADAHAALTGGALPAHAAARL